jgi:hypothetical protein
VTDHVAAEEQVSCAVELGSGGLPSALGVGPAAPFDQVVFDERVAGPHAADSFDAAIADRIPPKDMRGASLPRAAAIRVPADRESATVRPFNRVVFDDPVISPPAHEIKPNCGNGYAFAAC